VQWGQGKHCFVSKIVIVINVMNYTWEKHTSFFTV
jgi:hypothetical protein